MKFLKLSGETGFERGLGLGNKIKDICVHDTLFLERTLAEEKLSVEYGLKLASENEKVIAKHFPELLEEIHGLAEGSSLPYNRILLETAFPFTAHASSNCTVVSPFGTLTPDGVPVVGRNYDFLEEFKRCNQLRIVKGNRKNIPFVGGTVTILGVEEGLNGAGLFIGDAGCEPNELGSSRGLSSRQVMELVLQSCSSVDAAIDFIRHVPKFASNVGTCYLLADKREVAVIEMGLTESCVRELAEDIMIASNMFLTPIAEDVKPPEPRDSSLHDFIKTYLHKRQGKANKEIMQRLLSNHSHCICAHSEIDTLRSLIGKTDEGKVLVADGHPCTSSFQEVLIPK